MAVTELAAKRDEELCDTLEDLWFAAGAWPIQGIEPSRETVNINGSTFIATATLNNWMRGWCSASTPAKPADLQAQRQIKCAGGVGRSSARCFEL